MKLKSDVRDFPFHKIEIKYFSLFPVYSALMYSLYSQYGSLVISLSLSLDMLQKPVPVTFVFSNLPKQTSLKYAEIHITG